MHVKLRTMQEHQSNNILTQQGHIQQIFQRATWIRICSMDIGGKSLVSRPQTRRLLDQSIWKAQDRR